VEFVARGVDFLPEGIVQVVIAATVLDPADLGEQKLCDVIEREPLRSKVSCLRTCSAVSKGQETAAYISYLS